MGQLIIVTGPDRCGKTTLVQKLNQLILSEKKFITHFTKPPASILNPNKWSYNHYAENIYQFNKLISQKDFTIICDRFYEGEFVYGSRYRNFPETDFWKLEKYFINPKITKLILLTDNEENIKSRDDGNTIEETIDDLKITNSLFWDYYNKTSINKKLVGSLLEMTDELLLNFIKL